MIVHTLGDVHLGKKFENGVPLHRRGGRERMQFEQFAADLDTKCDLHIQMGDLFDKMYVPYSVIWAAYEAYRVAKLANPNTIYVVIRGNHDASRDIDKISAFQVFAALVRPHGIVVADDETVEVGDHVMIPWHPFKTALEMLPQDMTGLTAYGHWDVVMGDTNQIPAAELKARGVIKAFTGHDHNRRELEIDGLDVQVTGSMQPYSHAEDEAGSIYVTLTLREVQQIKIDLRDKCVRVLLQPGEELTEQVDCLQLQIKRVGVEDELVVDVQFDVFDMKALFEQAALDLCIQPAMAEVAYARLEEARVSRA